MRRNRIRRQIRHVFADLVRAENPLVVPGDYLVTVRDPRPDMAHDEVAAAVIGALERLEARR